MDKRKTRIITTKRVMEWATLPPPDRHASWSPRLSNMRVFARMSPTSIREQRCRPSACCWDGSAPSLGLQRRGDRCVV